MEIFLLNDFVTIVIHVIVIFLTFAKLVITISHMYTLLYLCYFMELFGRLIIIIIYGL